jgi:hypothetical protein
VFTNNPTESYFGKVKGKIQRLKMCLGNPPIKIGRFIKMIEEFNDDQTIRFEAFHGKVRQKKKCNSKQQSKNLPAGMDFNGTEPEESWAKRQPNLLKQNSRKSYLDEDVSIQDTPINESAKKRRKKKKKNNKKSVSENGRIKNITLNFLSDFNFKICQIFMDSTDFELRVRWKAHYWCI